jgi:hypothetical protein
MSFAQALLSETPSQTSIGIFSDDGTFCLKADQKAITEPLSLSIMPGPQ